MTTTNSIKKNEDVHSFHSIFLSGYLIFMQVQNENLEIKIYLSSSALGESLGILSIGHSFF